MGIPIPTATLAIKDPKLAGPIYMSFYTSNIPIILGFGYGVRMDSSLKNIKLQPVPPSMPLEAYEYPKTELIVPLMALMEAQVIILYIFFNTRVHTIEAY